MRRIIRKDLMEQDKQRQQQFAIQQAKDMLQSKKLELQGLQKSLSLVEDMQDRRRIIYKIDRCENAISKISSRLKNLGVEEKRGRPKKTPGERYQEQRKKFTAHLQVETFEYLQTLKANGSISNISAFIDELVLQHQKKNRE